MADNHIFPFMWMRGEDEQTMRTEIEKIYDCGIRSICVEARPHKDYCGPGWWHDLDIVIDEAKKRNMTIWILDDKHFPTGYANGLIEAKYPERKKQYLNWSSADIFGGEKVQEVNIAQMTQPNIMFWELGGPIDREGRAQNELFGVVAFRVADGKLLSEESIDLTADVKDGWLKFTLPAGQWKLYVIYKTRTDGGDPTYINMLDEVSCSTQLEAVYEPHFEHYKEEFGKTIAGFFSDEPQFGNVPGFGADCSPVIGEDPKQPMAWSDEMEERLRNIYGDKLNSQLLYFWNYTDVEKEAPKFRYNYMNIASQLYEKNFSNQLGKWCEDHGVEYIGHIVEDNGNHARLSAGPGHFFRAMSGQDMAGIDCIGAQVVYGAPTAERKTIVKMDGGFFMYTLGKMGASAGHLDPKKKGRTMCELFGAYGWKFGVRDMKFVLDHLLNRGVNYLVPHAFSMANYPDPDCPPHFYAGGNNPQYPYFQELMKYADRMCRQLSDGVHVPEVAVLYDAEAEWSGSRMAMQEVCRQLLNNQVEFDIVDIDMLTRQADRYKTEVKGDKLVINGMEFAALVVPYAERIPQALETFIEEHDKFPVFFADALPKAIVDIECDGSEKEEAAQLKSLKNVSVALLDKLAATLREDGFTKMSVAPKFDDLAIYHYERDGKPVYMLLNESAGQTFDGVVTLPAKNAAGVSAAELVAVDYLKKTAAKLEVTEDGEQISFHIVLEPAQSVIVAAPGAELENLGAREDEVDTAVNGSGADVASANAYRADADVIATLGNSLDLSKQWKVSRVRAKEYPAFPEAEVMDELVAISDIDRNFAGHIRYEKNFSLDQAPATAYIICENVFEVMRVTVNGTEAGVVLQPPYRMEIGKFLKAGDNEIRIEVASTPDRDQANYPAPPFLMTYESVEPTGMFGEVSLKY